MSGIEALATSVYSQSLQSINTAFSLATALAWMEAIKAVIKQYVRVGRDKPTMYIFYALIVTALSALVLRFTTQYLKQDIKNNSHLALAI